MDSFKKDILAYSTRTALSIAAFFFSAFFAVFLLGDNASAQSPTYTWTSSSRIEIGSMPESLRSISDEGGGGTLTVNSPGSDSTSRGTGVFKIRVSSGFAGLSSRECSVTLQVVVNADNVTGRISTVDSIGEGGTAGGCPQWIQDVFQGNINISGQRFADAEQEEQERNRSSIIVLLSTPLEYPAGPDTVTARIRVPAPRACDHSSCNQTLTLHKYDADGLTAYRGGHANINPDTYVVGCTSNSLPFSCVEVEATKVSGAMTTVRLGETNDTKKVDVYVAINNRDYETTTPTVVIYEGFEGDTVVASQVTQQVGNDDDRIVDALLPDNDDYSLMSAGTIFDGIEPGLYRACILEESGPNYCETFTKSEGRISFVNIMVGFDLITEDEDVCTGGPMSWFTCPFGVAIANLVGWVAGIVEGLLYVEPLTLNTDNPIFAVWSVVRNLSNIGLILVFLAVIISQITSMGLTNYGIKRILPRLVVAAVAINVSYFICAFAVDIFNLLGAGVEGVFAVGIDAASSIELEDGNVAEYVGTNPGHWLGLIGASLAGLAIAAYTGVIGLILGPLAIGLMAIIVSFVFLIIRQVLITLLIIVSPIAFLMWLAPGSESFFNFWRRTFITLLMTYPIVMALFAGSALVASIINSAGIDDTVWGLGEGEAITALIVYVVLTIPLFLLPLVLQIASGFSKGRLKMNRQRGKKFTGAAKRVGQSIYQQSAGYRRSQQNKTARQTKRDQRAANMRQGTHWSGGLGKFWSKGVMDSADSAVNAATKGTRFEGKGIPGSKTREVASTRLDAMAQATLNQEQAELSKSLGEAIKNSEYELTVKNGNDADKLHGALTDALARQNVADTVAAVNLIVQNRGFKQLQETLDDTIAGDSEEARELLHEAFRENLPDLDSMAPELAGYATTPRSQALKQNNTSVDQLAESAYKDPKPSMFATARPASVERGVQHIPTERINEALNDPKIVKDMKPGVQEMLREELRRR